MIGDGAKRQALTELFARGDYKETKDAAADYVKAYPADVEARYILAASLVRLGEYDAARREIDRIYAAVPGHLGAGLEEAQIYKREGRVISEIEHLERYTAALHELLDGKTISEDVRQYITRSLAEAENLLGHVYTRVGMAETAIRAFLRSAAMTDGMSKRLADYDNALFIANYLPADIRDAATETIIDGYRTLLSQMGYTPAALDGIRCAQAKERQDRQPSARDGICGRQRGDRHIVQDGQITRRIRIGYVSPDLRMHPVAAFLMPLLLHYDRDAFHVTCYANNTEDHVSEEMRTLVDAWHNVQGTTPAAIARQIAADGIDILIDLAGHTKGNLLPVFALRPAPVQITALGYFNTTGLFEMDYILGDEVIDPAIDAQGYAPGFTERVLRLSTSHFCYHPLTVFPKVTEPPRTRNGYVTFGSFNNFNKVNDEVLRVWSAILHEIKDARLLLKSFLFVSEEGRMFALRRLEAAGIDVERVELRPASDDYLKDYGDMDIALDTFPYTGGITTCEALYMGVPVVSLAGRSHGARFSAGLLHYAGLAELVAADVSSYVRLALLLANDAALLADLRQNLRDGLAASPVMDEISYVREVEEKFKDLLSRSSASRSPVPATEQ